MQEEKKNRIKGKMDKPMGIARRSISIPFLVTDRTESMVNKKLWKIMAALATILT